jgi:hypothetical protein
VWNHAGYLVVCSSAYIYMYMYTYMIHAYMHTYRQT